MALLATQVVLHLSANHQAIIVLNLGKPPIMDYFGMHMHSYESSSKLL